MEVDRWVEVDLVLFDAGIDGHRRDEICNELLVELASVPLDQLRDEVAEILIDRHIHECDPEWVEDQLRRYNA